VTNEPAATSPYAPFHPRMTRIVGRAIAAVLVLGGIALLYASPGAEGPWYDPLNTVAMVALVALSVLLVLRHATVFALVDPQGIRVRNLVRTTTLSWDRIEGVRFGAGEPWVTLDLVDGRTLAVMAIQSADGAYAHRESQRLAALVIAGGGGVR
jgi:hypothetical protein